ncbi:MAG: methyltransferase domain-containing protein [Pseudonocardia sp.]|nr:methyltransferase domain-containing protein [Pseudonocardia sp.]
MTENWRATFRAVPRHLFVPDLVWRHHADRRGLEPIRRSDQPEEWLESVYMDQFLITQINDGATPAGAADGVVTDVDYTSSTSMPSVVAEMLAVLRVKPGMRVLEIGTGTGWNTALLAHRLGARNVVSTEIDPEISVRARNSLAKAGYDAATVVTGDGTFGHPARAPYERVLSTAAVFQVPYAWIGQTRPGGLVVTPWATEYYNGHLLALSVRSDGGALGRIVGKTAFMAVRDQRIRRIRISDVVTDEGEELAERHYSRRHPRWYVADYDTRTAIGIQVPRCRYRYTPADDEHTDGILWFLDQWSGSWAAVHHRPGEDGPYLVRQYGPRQLFDEISAAYQDWKKAGKPPASAWRIIVTPNGQRAELSSAQAA